MRNEYEPVKVSVPGATLKEALQERGMSQAQLADRMGRPKKTVNEIVKGLAAITPETAIQLERVLGIPATFWNSRQRLYDEACARSASREKLAMADEWQRRFPVSGMVRNGWISSDRGSVVRTEALLHFFGIGSPDEWESVYGSPRLGTAFRESAAFRADPYALSAWLRQGERLADRLATEPFRRQSFVTAFEAARGLVRESPQGLGVHLQQMFAAAGVAVVFVPLVKGVHASGATRWLTPVKAMLLLSLRGKREDMFWFSFFHEVAHILLHGKRATFVEDGQSSRSDEEKEADVFACDVLIPPAKWKKFANAGAIYTTELVERFAESVSASAGVVVGRLQHEGLIPRSALNHLRCQVSFLVEGEA